MKKYYLFLLFLGCFFDLYSQDFLELNNLFFNKVDQAQGLPALENPYIKQDSKGFIWISSQDGLNKFDGKEILTFRPTLPNGNADPHISSDIFEDSKNRIWFTTYGGLHCINPETNKIASKFLQIDSSDVSPSDHYLFHADKKDNLWIIADSTLHKYNTNTGKDSLYNFQIGTYACYPWIDLNGDIKGIIKPKIDDLGGFDIIEWDGDSIRKKSFFTGTDEFNLPQIFGLFLHIEGDSVIWASTFSGLLRFSIGNPQNYEFFKPESFSTSPRFWDISIYKRNFFILGSSNDGFFVFDIREKKFIKNHTSIIVNDFYEEISNVNNVNVDDDGNIWLSSWNQGIYYSNDYKNRFISINKDDFINQKSKLTVTAIIEDDNQLIWAAIPNSGLYIFDENLNLISVHKEIKGESIVKNETKLINLFCDSDGDVWIITTNKIFIWDKERKEFIKIPNTFEVLTQVEEVSKDVFIILTLKNAYKISKEKLIRGEDKLTKIIEDHGWNRIVFNDNNHRFFASDRFDNLKIFELIDDKIKVVADLSGLGYINAVTLLGDGYYWLVGNRGLQKMDSISFNLEKIDLEENLSLNHILKDSLKTLWISSNSSIYNFSPSQGILKKYTPDDGFQKMQFVRRCGLTSSKLKLFFGGTRGIVAFNPDEMTTNKEEVRIELSKIMINDSDYLDSICTFLSKPKFSYNNNTLSFNFISLNYSSSNKSIFKFYMENYDKDTVVNNDNGFIRYPNLPPGKYALNVWAANSDDVWNKNSKKFSFEIYPPWYLTVWFKSFSFLSVLFISYAIYKYRIKQIQKEAKYKQIVAETQTAVLRLQMNPHFIFNSMNSISSFILSNKLDLAQDYLARFGRLMRKILINSEKNVYSLREEIAFLREYIIIESQRFKRPFKFKFNIADSIDIDDVFIPPMILQPFVENAIWHGIAEKEDKGQLDINFFLSANYLICEVNDNGVGRIAASKRRNISHEPKALSITQKRLDLLEVEMMIKYASSPIKIMDITNKEGDILGTKVELQIPLL